MYYCDLRKATKDYIKEKGFVQAMIDIGAMISGVAKELQEERVEGESKTEKGELDE